MQIRNKNILSFINSLAANGAVTVHVRMQTAICWLLKWCDIHFVHTRIRTRAPLIYMHMHCVKCKQLHSERFMFSGMEDINIVAHVQRVTIE